MNDPILIWFIVGAALMLLEFAAPGLVLIFFGLGSWVVSLAKYLGFIDGLQGQLLLFSFASLLFLVLLRKYMKAWFVGDSSVEEDEFATEFIGKTVVVTHAIPGGSIKGKIELKGADWNARSKSAHAVGDIVKVIDRDGLNLTVE